MSAEKKISEMPAAGALTGDEYFEIVQDGVNKKLTLENIGKLANDFQSENFLTTSATPAVLSLPGAGASPTIAIAGNNASGKVTITTGTTSLSGDLFRITLDTYSYPFSAICTITPGNAAAAGILNKLSTSGTPNTTTIALSSAPADATQYIFNYAINGY
jgi:hypothetical protein